MLTFSAATKDIISCVNLIYIYSPWTGKTACIIMDSQWCDVVSYAYKCTSVSVNRESCMPNGYWHKDFLLWPREPRKGIGNPEKLIAACFKGKFQYTDVMSFSPHSCTRYRDVSTGAPSWHFACVISSHFACLHVLVPDVITTNHFKWTCVQHNKFEWLCVLITTKFHKYECQVRDLPNDNLGRLVVHCEKAKESGGDVNLTLLKVFLKTIACSELDTTVGHWSSESSLQ